MRSPSRTSSSSSVRKASLRRFAEAPDAYLAPMPGVHTLDEARFFATVMPGKWIGVCRLDFAPTEAARVLAEVRALEPAVSTSWQTPRADLAAALRVAGCHDPAPPLEPRFTALATDTPPPPVAGIEVRRIETLEDHVAGLEIEHASSAWSEERKQRRLAEAAQTFERRRARPGGQWLAYLDGRAVGWGSAVAGPLGMYLSGGAVVPDARGRGAYRALVRARWDDAVERGTPALTVGAQETSRSILERLGFERVCTMYELESDA
jgi:GNAT superfamily N-acetyltransferase